MRGKYRTVTVLTANHPDRFFPRYRAVRSGTNIKAKIPVHTVPSVPALSPNTRVKLIEPTSDDSCKMSLIAFVRFPAVLCYIIMHYDQNLYTLINQHHC